MHIGKCVLMTEKNMPLISMTMAFDKKLRITSSTRKTKFNVHFKHHWKLK